MGFKTFDTVTAHELVKNTTLIVTRVACTGLEKSLMSCPKQTVGNHADYPNEGVKLTCSDYIRKYTTYTTVVY